MVPEAKVDLLNKKVKLEENLEKFRKFANDLTLAAPPTPKLTTLEQYYPDHPLFWWATAHKLELLAAEVQQKKPPQLKMTSSVVLTPAQETLITLARAYDLKNTKDGIHNYVNQIYLDPKKRAAEEAHLCRGAEFLSRAEALRLKVLRTSDNDRGNLQFSAEDEADWNTILSEWVWPSKFDLIEARSMSISNIFLCLGPISVIEPLLKINQTLKNSSMRQDKAAYYKKPLEPFSFRESQLSEDSRSTMYNSHLDGFVYNPELWTASMADTLEEDVMSGHATSAGVGIPQTSKVPTHEYSHGVHDVGGLYLLDQLPQSHRALLPNNRYEAWALLRSFFSRELMQMAQEKVKKRYKKSPVPARQVKLGEEHLAIPEYALYSFLEGVAELVSGAFLKDEHERLAVEQAMFELALPGLDQLASQMVERLKQPGGLERLRKFVRFAQNGYGRTIHKVPDEIMANFGFPGGEPPWDAPVERKAVWTEAMRIIDRAMSIDQAAEDLEKLKSVMDRMKNPDFAQRLKKEMDEIRLNLYNIYGVNQYGEEGWNREIEKQACMRIYREEMLQEKVENRTGFFELLSQEQKDDLSRKESPFRSFEEACSDWSAVSSDASWLMGENFGIMSGAPLQSPDAQNGVPLNVGELYHQVNNNPSNAQNNGVGLIVPFSSNEGRNFSNPVSSFGF